MSRTQMRALTISPHYLLVTLALALVAAVAFGALPFRQAEAVTGTDFTPDEITANGAIDLEITGSDNPDNTTLYVLTIGEFSTGSAQFSFNAGQSLVCVNGEPCDTDEVDSTTTVGLRGTGTPGVVLVNIVQYGQGAANTSPVDVSYRQIAAVSSIQLVAANGITHVPDEGEELNLKFADSPALVNLPLTAMGEATNQLVLSAIVQGHR